VVLLLSALSAALFLPLLSDERREARPPLPAEPQRRGSIASRPSPGGKRLAPAPPRRATPASAQAPAPSPKLRSATAPPSRHPPAFRAAIVIDDLGQRIEHLEELARLEIPLSIAVIPGLAATASTVREAGRLGIEVLLHQPMEPHEEGGKDPGEGVLLVSMTPAALHDQMRNNLAAVPDAVGVNNHMGSRFTEDAAALGLLMGELKARGLFWLDSRTSAATQGAAVARAAGVAAIERDVFIDAERDPDFIRNQLRKLLDLARRRGAAVGIGHPRPETLAVLRELRDELLASGVTLVPVSELVRAASDGTAGPALAAAPPAAKPGGGLAAP
jgi:hypothetical protein